MKNYFGILIPTLLSATALTLAIACAPQESRDSVNARRACDPSKSRCDNKTAQESVFGKLGADTLLEDLKKELDAEKNVTQKNANKEAAKSIRNLGLKIQDSKVTLTLTNSSKKTVILSGELKEKKADLTSDEGSTKASIRCLDQAGTCSTTRVDILTPEKVVNSLVDGKVKTNNTFKGKVTPTEGTTMAKVKAIIRDAKAEFSTAEMDLTGKSGAFQKVYNLIRANAQGSHGENSIKGIAAQSSEIAYGKSFISIVALSNENEVIGLEGELELVAKNETSATNRAFEKNVNADLLQKLQPSADVKKAILDSITGVTLTSLDSGNRLGFQLRFKGADAKAEELLQTVLTLSLESTAQIKSEAKSEAKKEYTEEEKRDQQLESPEQKPEQKPEEELHFDP